MCINVTQRKESCDRQKFNNCCSSTAGWKKTKENKTKTSTQNTDWFHNSLRDFLNGQTTLITKQIKNKKTRSNQSQIATK